MGKPRCAHEFGSDGRCTREGCSMTVKRLEALRAGTAAAAAKRAAQRAQRAGVDMTSSAEPPTGEAVTDPDVVVTPYPPDSGPQAPAPVAQPDQAGPAPDAAPVVEAQPDPAPVPQSTQQSTRGPGLLGGVLDFVKDGIGWGRTD